MSFLLLNHFPFAIQNLQLLFCIYRHPPRIVFVQSKDSKNLKKHPLQRPAIPKKVMFLQIEYHKTSQKSIPTSTPLLTFYFLVSLMIFPGFFQGSIPGLGSFLLLLRSERFDRRPILRGARRAGHPAGAALEGVELRRSAVAGSIGLSELGSFSWMFSWHFLFTFCFLELL